MAGTENEADLMRHSVYDWRRLHELIGTLMAKSGDGLLHRGRYDFSRDGVLTPQLLVTLVLYMIADAGRRGYALLLESFWREAQQGGVALPNKPVSATAFCSARQKLTGKLFVSLLEAVYASVGQLYGASTLWHGRRILAVDATRINTRRSYWLRRAYGVPTGAHCPQLMVTCLYDIGARMPVGAVITPNQASERDQLVALLPLLRRGDVLVADRGYPSFDICEMLAHAGVDFVIRVPTSHTFEAIDVLRQSGGTDYRVNISSNDRQRNLEVRGIRAFNPESEELCFLTTLRRNDFSVVQLTGLYRLRWNEEEYFKAFKSDYFGPHQFHSTRPSGVEQEVHAAMLFWALTRFLMLAAGSAKEVPHEHISPKASVLAVAEVLVPLLLATDPKTINVLSNNILERLSRSAQRPRLGRRFARRSFRPSPRWGPNGRRGADGRS